MANIINRIMRAELYHKGPNPPQRRANPNNLSRSERLTSQHKICSGGQAGTDWRNGQKIAAAQAIIGDDLRGNQSDRGSAPPCTAVALTGPSPRGWGSPEMGDLDLELQAVAGGSIGAKGA
jgi:hypothetical protein